MQVLDHHGQFPIPDLAFAGRAGLRGPIATGRDESTLACCKCAADELDSELITVHIDVGDHFGEGRSSSAAKDAEAVLRISFARRSSRFSRRNRRSSSSSSVVAPGSVPTSRLACFSHPRIVCGEIPSFVPTVWAADHCEHCVW